MHSPGSNTISSISRMLTANQPFISSKTLVFRLNKKKSALISECKNKSSLKSNCPLYKKLNSWLPNADVIKGEVTKMLSSADLELFPLSQLLPQDFLAVAQARCCPGQEQSQAMIPMCMTELARFH